MISEEKELLTDKILQHYGDIFSEVTVEQFANDINSLLNIGSKYRQGIKEWLNGKCNITDVTVTSLDGNSFWSLVEVAEELDSEIPNIPVAAFLMSLYEEFPVTLSEVLSVCGEICWCDESIITSESPECVFAYLDKEYEQWFFLGGNSNEENLKCHQLWQVLLQIPDLAPIIVLDHLAGTTLELMDDGKYLITSPEEMEIGNE